MRVTVTVKGGPQAGRRTTLMPPARLSVGRSTASDWTFAEDPYLSNRHFEIASDADTCCVRDLKSANGTFINGKRVSGGRLLHQCDVVAGQTVITIAPEIGVAAMLARSQPLYAILDAARTPRVLELLSVAQERFESLYSGESAVHLAAYAPYLVEAPPRSRLLRKLAREGWGQSWGVFLVSKSPFEEIWQHFRRFLMVRDEAGSDYYFRFYDPRVLQAYLASCTTEERGVLFGPIERFWADDPLSLEARP